jgi:hypothetical protein
MPITLATQEAEIRRIEPAQAISWQDPILKKTSQKRAGGVAQDVGPEFNPRIPRK